VTQSLPNNKNDVITKHASTRKNHATQKHSHSFSSFISNENHHHGDNPTLPSFISCFILELRINKRKHNLISQRMMSARVIILEWIFPCLGVILANIMFSASYRDVKRAVARGSLGDLNPTPWAFMLGNCCGWVTYSFLIQNYWVFFGNAPGFVLSVWLNLAGAKVQYQNHRANEMRKSFANYMEETQKEFQLSLRQLQVKRHSSTAAEEQQQAEESPEDSSPVQKAVDFGKTVWEVTSQNMQAPAPHENITLGVVLVWVAVISFIAFANVSQSTRELIVGLVVNLNLIFFYLAPLSTIFAVLKTKNSASIHIWTMLTNTANGIFWGVYGLAVLDPFIYAPNSIGAGLGIVQMLLCLTFPRKSLEEVEGLTSASAEQESTILVQTEHPLASDTEPVKNKGEASREHAGGDSNNEVDAV
jgi:solute carrier family 50 protein (sugar transporter)